MDALVSLSYRESFTGFDTKGLKAEASFFRTVGLSEGITLLLDERKGAKKETFTVLGSVDTQVLTTNQSSPGRGAISPRWSHNKAMDAQGSDFSFVTPSTSSFRWINSGGTPVDEPFSVRSDPV